MPKGEGFKTIYKAAFSSGGVLQNEIFPIYIHRLMGGIATIDNKEKEGITLVMSMLSTLLPPLKKLLRNYDELKTRLLECRRLHKEWLGHYQNHFPSELADQLRELYEDWWVAYNESGAGIEIYIHDPSRNRKVYNYLTGQRPQKSTALNISDL